MTESKLEKLLVATKDWLALRRSAIAIASTVSGSNTQPKEHQRNIDEALDADVARQMTKTKIDGWEMRREDLRYGLWRCRVEDLEDHVESVRADLMVILEVQLKARRRSAEPVATISDLLDYDSWVSAKLKRRGVCNPYISTEMVTDSCVRTIESTEVKLLAARFAALGRRISSEPKDTLAYRLSQVCKVKNEESAQYAAWVTLRWLICWGALNRKISDEDIQMLYSQATTDEEKKELARLRARTDLSEQEALRKTALKAKYPSAVNALQFEHLSVKALKAFSLLVEPTKPLGDEADLFWLTYLDDQLWGDSAEDDDRKLLSSATRLQSERLFQENCERSGFSVNADDGGEGRGQEIYNVLSAHAKAKGIEAEWRIGPDTSSLETEGMRRDGETIFVRCANGWKVEDISCAPLMIEERPAFIIKANKDCLSGRLKLVLIAGHAPAPDRIRKSARWFAKLETLTEEYAEFNTVVMGDFNTSAEKCNSTIDGDAFISEFYSAFEPSLSEHVTVFTSVKMSGEGASMYSEPYDKILVPKKGPLKIVTTMRAADRWRKALQARRYSDHCFVTSTVRIPT